MQSAETVLDVIRKRGERGLPSERVYRQLFNPQLYLMAYGRIYSNHGAMTPGVTGETADGMSLEKIGTIIDALRGERYRWTPVKRVYIPKKKGKKRPLGLPTWSDKVVAEVVRLLLEAYYDVQFSDHSHGFRPRRGCHTALDEVVRVWKGTHWFIEGDISDCFGSLDHKIMLSILAERIRDGRLLRLISNMLRAGYLEDWRWNATLSGTPQGGVASPILSNIYLDRLDQFVEQQLLPVHNHGRLRWGVERLDDGTNCSSVAPPLWCQQPADRLVDRLASQPAVFVAACALDEDCATWQRHWLIAGHADHQTPSSHLTHRSSGRSRSGAVIRPSATIRASIASRCSLRNRSQCFSDHLSSMGALLQKAEPMRLSQALRAFSSRPSTVSSLLRTHPLSLATYDRSASHRLGSPSGSAGLSFTVRPASSGARLELGGDDPQAARQGSPQYSGTGPWRPRRSRGAPHALQLRRGGRSSGNRSTRRG
jgi:retron-type reverse transcriptase